jgi:hypothetical protein
LIYFNDFSRQRRSAINFCAIVRIFSAVITPVIIYSR